MTLFVANLNYRIEQDELRALFEQYGEVSSMKIVTDRDTGRSKGFGFVDMPDENEAQEAIAALNGMNYAERKLVVKEAEERKPSGPRGGGYGGGGYGGGGGGYRGGGGGGYRGGGGGGRY